MTYTEGILGDGAAILKDGVMVPIEEVVARFNDMERYLEALRRLENHHQRLTPMQLRFVDRALYPEKNLNPFE